MKCTISEPSIAIKPSAKLIDFIEDLHLDPSIELPVNLLHVYRTLTKDTRDRSICTQTKPTPEYSSVEKKYLIGLCNDSTKLVDFEKRLESLIANADDDIETITSNDQQESKKNEANEASKLTLNLIDLKWLNQYLSECRQSKGDTVYLHELIEDAQLILPQNEYVERNPELEKRCQRLKREQEDQCYRAMTRNVDLSRAHIPDDSIAFQMQQINRHLIAVLQFIFSVLAGFAFGFIGVELIVGNLDFGFRLLLGIICALVIALAEIYFLAKKLNKDYENGPPIQHGTHKEHKD